MVKLKCWKKTGKDLWRKDRTNSIGIESFSSKYVKGKGFERKNYAVAQYKNGKYKLLTNPTKTKSQALKYAKAYMKKNKC